MCLLFVLFPLRRRPESAQGERNRRKRFGPQFHLTFVCFFFFIYLLIYFWNWSINRWWHIFPTHQSSWCLLMAEQGGGFNYFCRGRYLCSVFNGSCSVLCLRTHLRTFERPLICFRFQIHHLSSLDIISHTSNQHTHSRSQAGTRDEKNYIFLMKTNRCSIPLPPIFAYPHPHLPPRNGSNERERE